MPTLSEVVLEPELKHVGGCSMGYADRTEGQKDSTVSSSPHSVHFHNSLNIKVLHLRDAPTCIYSLLQHKKHKFQKFNSSNVVCIVCIVH